MVVHKTFNLLGDSLYRGSMFIFLSQATSAGLGFLFWIVAARYYPQDEVGYATAIMSSISLLILISRVGLDQSIIRYFPDHDRSSVLTTALVVTTILSFVMGIAYILLATSWASSFQVVYDNPLVFMTLLLTTSFISIFSSAAIAMRKSELYFVQNLLIGLRVPLLIPLAMIGLVGILISTAAATILAVVVMIPMLGRMRLKLRGFDLDFVKESFHFSMVNYFSIFLGSAPSLLLPTLVLFILGAENAAIYFIAYSISSILYMVPSALGVSLFVEGSHGQPLLRNITKALVIAILVLIPVVIILAVGSSWFLSLMGPEYVNGGSELLIVMAISSFFILAYQLYISVLNVKKKFRSLLLFSGLQFILLIGLGCLFPLEFGLHGLGYAWLVSSVVMATVIIWVERRNVPALLSTLEAVDLRNLV